MASFERSNLVAYEQAGSDITRIAVQLNGMTRQGEESGTSLGFRRTSGRRAGGSAEQVTRHTCDGEAPTGFAKRFEICLDEEFDGLLAAIDLDAIRQSPKSKSCRRPFLPRMIAWGKNQTPRFGAVFTKGDNWRNEVASSRVAAILQF